MVHHPHCGSDDDVGDDGKDSVSDMDVRNVEDVDELHDLDSIAGDTCKGDSS